MTALRLRWFARFEFPDPAEEDRWYQGPPSRMAMLALADRCRAAGMSKVVYVSERTLWDPDPPGLWLANPARSNES